MRPNGIQLTRVSVEPAEQGLVKLTVEVAPSSVQEARQRVIKEYSKRIRVPGFRPGSVPAGIVRRNVGDEAINQEVAEAVVGTAYSAALQQENVEPLEQGQVSDLEFDAFDDQKPLTFVATVIARPQITLGSTDGLEATKRAVAVGDEDVENALTQMREEAAYLKNATEGRAVQDGDVLFAEVQVYVDGQPRSDEPANLRGFVVGQSGFVPPIDEHLVGMNLDETKRFTVTYPEDFPEEDLREKEAEFEVKVTAIKERVVPELTDEFAQIRRAQNVEDLRSQLRDYLLATSERESRREVREALVEKVVEASTVEVPGALVALRVGERVGAIQNELQQNGATMEAYLHSINSTQQQLETDLREEIESELKTELILDEIARNQQFDVTQEEAINHYQLMASVTNTPPQELVQQVPIENVRTSILQRKSIDFLVEKAKVTDEEGNEISLNALAMQDEAEDALEEAALEGVLTEDDLNEGDYADSLGSDEDDVDSEVGGEVEITEANIESGETSEEAAASDNTSDASSEAASGTAPSA